MIKAYLLPVERVENTDRVKGSEHIHDAIVECTEDPNTRKLIMDTTPEENNTLSVLAIEVREPTTNEVDSLNRFKAEPLPEPEPPLSTHISIIDAIDTSKARPVRIKRVWEGKDYFYDCFATESVKDQYLAGDVVVGDYVIVHYDDIGEQVVTGKVFKSW